MATFQNMPRVKRPVIKSPTLNGEDTADSHTLFLLVPDVSTHIVTTASPVITSSMCMNAFLSKKEFPSQFSLQTTRWDRALFRAATSVSLNGEQTADAGAPHDERWYKASLLLRKSSVLSTSNYYDLITIPGLPELAFDRNPRNFLDRLFSLSAEGTFDDSKLPQLSQQPLPAPDRNLDILAHASSEMLDASHAVTLERSAPDTTSTSVDDDLLPLRTMADRNHADNQKSNDAEPKTSPRHVNISDSIAEGQHKTVVPSAPQWKSNKRKRPSPGIQLDRSMLLRIEAEIYRAMRPKRNNVGKPNYMDDSSSSRISLTASTTTIPVRRNSPNAPFATKAIKTAVLRKSEEKTPQTNRGHATGRNKKTENETTPADPRIGAQCLGVGKQVDMPEITDGRASGSPFLTLKPSTAAAFCESGESTSPDHVYSPRSGRIMIAEHEMAVIADVFAPIDNYPSVSARRVPRNQVTDPSVTSNSNISYPLIATTNINIRNTAGPSEAAFSAAEHKSGSPLHAHRASWDSEQTFTPRSAERRMGDEES